VGTNQIVGVLEVKRTPESVPLSRNLSGDVARALAQASAALLAVANAFNGEGNFCALPSPSPGLSVTAAINEFLLAKARAGKSDRYLRALRNSLSKFADGRGRTSISLVSHGEIEKWLDEHDWMPRTQLGYLSDVRTLFNFHVRRGNVSHNPANAVENPVCEDAPPSIHAPETVRAVLEAARRWDLNLCRSLAIRYFAGIRTSEAAALKEREIGAEFIEVTAAKSKTRRRRLVEIQPCLKAWLALGGSVEFGDYGNRSRLFYKASGLVWPHNVTRHSFVSYHLAKFQNAGKTALEAGHTEQMLFSNYRELVTCQAAQSFWEIRPG
jgi:integrase